MKKIMFLLSVILFSFAFCTISYASTKKINTVRISVEGDDYDYESLFVDALDDGYYVDDFVVIPENEEIGIYLEADDDYRFNIKKQSQIVLKGCKYVSCDPGYSSLYVSVRLDNTIGKVLDSVATSIRGWKQDASGWWWDNGDNTFPKNCWKWIDGNSDGRYECYYFGPDGYCLMNTTTPDGYTVGGDGAWIYNGAIPYRTSENGTTMIASSAVASSGSSKTSGASTSNNSGSGGNSYSTVGTYVLNTRSGKFHHPWCEAVGKMSSWNKKVVNMSRSRIIGQGYVPCKICWP